MICLCILLSWRSSLWIFLFNLMMSSSYSPISWRRFRFITTLCKLGLFCNAFNRESPHSSLIWLSLKSSDSSSQEEEQRASLMESTPFEDILFCLSDRLTMKLLTLSASAIYSHSWSEMPHSSMHRVEIEAGKPYSRLKQKSLGCCFSNLRLTFMFMPISFCEMSSSLRKN